MKCKSWTNIFLGITCALCIFIAFLVFIVALIYLSVFVIATPKNSVGGCSKMDQFRGIECAPKIEQLSLALEQIESDSPADFERVKDIANVCQSTLSCVEPIKCKSITQEYEFVKKSCAIFELAASDANFCVRKLQKHYISQSFLIGPTSCLPRLDTQTVHQKMCQLYDSDRKCAELEILSICDPDINGQFQEVIDKIRELYDCRKYQVET